MTTELSWSLDSDEAASLAQKYAFDAYAQKVELRLRAQDIAASINIRPVEIALADAKVALACEVDFRAALADRLEAGTVRLKTVARTIETAARDLKAAIADSISTKVHFMIRTRTMGATGRASA